ncbi:MAG: prepilin-type N-terminal cleavage/methylation domain-containing protein [Treponema sp.]|uniref:PulJ/GspJ family protein n=1 Tax=Treponema sp. TaxID=166 RepID=UPI002A91F83A|nr:prepilin-type N-terminal cleavage/methylation domain-containing protein [Treponema sp.]MDY6397352.1 prepilin-type N-terminal cleavage/methylation domain-containing protein [Treponema sp.]
MNIILSSASCAVGEARMRYPLRWISVPIKTSRHGFTLLEMLIAMTVAAIITTVSLNVYSMFHHGVVATSDNYVHFATGKAQELRCRTRFVRGLPPCSDTLNSHQIIFKSKKNFFPRF